MPGCLCDVCGKDFDDPSNLNRHKRTTHDMTTSHNCPLCSKTFPRTDNLTRHLKKIHNAALHHQCQMCEESFSSRALLSKHRKVHEAAKDGPASTTSAPKLFKCSHCGKDYASDQSLKKHCKIKHADMSARSGESDGEVKSFKCAVCEYTGSSYILLTEHLVDCHQYHDDVESKVFKGMEEFWAWKECVEVKGFVSFVNDRGMRQLVQGKKFYLECHRSGFFESSGKGLRETKESCKIGAVCPARMDVVERLDKSVSVTWHRNHFGHECDINFLRLTKTERNMISTKLKNHESFDSILDTIRESLETPQDFKRLHLLEKRDLWNILRAVEFKHNHAHSNDYISVEILVESLKKRGEKNPVLFYKAQDRPCTCSDPHCCLTDSDFMLVISTPYQREELAKFTDEKVLIDSTHGTNSYDFQLTTLGTVDSAGVGVPVAYCLSNHVSEEFMKQLFRILKPNLKKSSPSTKVFMSDMANEFYVAWQSVFGDADNVFYCSWHVDQRWRKKTKEKVKGLSKQAEVYRALITLRNILDKEWFEIAAEGFKLMLNEDPDTQPFLLYLERYLRCKEKWAYCFRDGLGLNVNMFMEALFKKLKYCYMKGKTLRRVDECMNILLRWTRDVAFERLTRLCKGNNAYRQVLINNSHKASALVSIEGIVEVVTDAQWTVPSCQAGSDNCYNVLRNVDSNCSGCELTCNRCSFCIHEFKCSCFDYLVHGNMCKHIHAVCSTFFEFNNNSSDRRLMEQVQDEMEAMCEKGNDNCHIGKDVQTSDMWNPISSNLKVFLDQFTSQNVSEAVVQGGLKFMEILRKELPECMSSEPSDPPTAVTPSPACTPSLLRLTPCPSNEPCAVTPSPACTPSLLRLTPCPRTPGTPVNRRISTQRRLVNNFRSTKKKPLKKKINFAQPTFFQQGSYLANFALGPDHEVLNVHAREFDHNYCQNDIDDNY